MKTSIPRPSLRVGFTLIELLVVIAIIAILVALLMPAVQQVREAARKAQCHDHMHNLAIAVHSYEGTFGQMPLAALNKHNWRVAVFPFIEQKPLYDKLDFVGTSDFAGNTTDANTPLLRSFAVPVFVCPSSPLESNPNAGGWNPNRYQAPHYAAIGGARHTGSGNCNSFYGVLCDNGPMEINRTHRFAEVTDGLSNVMLLGERSDTVRWTGASSWEFTNGKTQGVASFRGGWHGPGNTSPYNTQYSAGISGIATVIAPPNAPCGSFFECGVVYASATHLASAHPGGINVAMGDAVVKFVSENIDFTTFKYSAMRADGNPANL
ncbi:MAG: DUF1559 domain-containing protein [Planctomycetaceae bacterium]